uniref:Ig-like domain-containing protein n=1 Tax=Lepisosteus oculatus TaxID=7918 RepID=W5M001_LEPOC
MSLSAGVLLVLLFVQYASGDVLLTQSSSEIGKPGQSLRLSCAVSGYSLTDSSYATSWIRQPPGKRLEFLAEIYHDGSANYQDSIKGRFTVSKSGGSVYLQMNSLQSDDTAVYYCARR